jgi:hypothetical protein
MSECGGREQYAPAPYAVAFEVAYQEQRASTGPEDLAQALFDDEALLMLVKSSDDANAVGRAVLSLMDGYWKRCAFHEVDNLVAFGDVA